MAKASNTAKAEKVEMKSVLLKPRITEKAVIKHEEEGVYAFNVEKSATKKQIADSIKAKYKVTPVGVRVLGIPKKVKFFRGAWGTKGGGKKAYVYLKKGDKIDVA